MPLGVRCIWNVCARARVPGDETPARRDLPVPGLRHEGRPSPVTTIAQNPGARWVGWIDGRCGKPCCFTENRRLAEIEAPSERPGPPRRLPSPYVPAPLLPFESMTR